MEPESNGSQQFYVSAAHGSERKESGEYGKYDGSDTNLYQHVWPELHSAGNPEKGRTQCDHDIQPVGNGPTLDVGYGCGNQRNCQSDPEQVDEMFAIHGTRSRKNDLPNSNHDLWSAFLSDSADPPFSRRAIPDTAEELTWPAPDGWALRQFDWQQHGPEARGSVLFMTGRADFYEKYLETFHDFRMKGWNVTSVDWRGQGGSGRCGPHPHVGHIEDFAIWIDDLSQLFVEWRQTRPGPHIVIGHSMGGHLVMRALAEQRIHPDAVILSAPMLAPAGGGMPEWTAQLIARIMCAFGRARRRAWKVSEKPLEPEVLRQGLLTHDAERYADEFYWFSQRPELRLGPASWRWVERAYNSAHHLRERKKLEQVDIPILFLATETDRLVDHATIMRAVHLIPTAELQLFGDECAHEIYRESDAVRNVALDASFRFLDRVAPAG